MFENVADKTRSGKIDKIALSNGVQLSSCFLFVVLLCMFAIYFYYSPKHFLFVLAP